MKFRRWVVFSFFIHVLVVVLDKGAGLVLFKILEDEPDLYGALQLITILPFVMMSVANLGLATSSVYYLRKKRFPVHEVAETTSLVALVWGGFVALAAIAVSQFVLPLIQPEWSFRLAYVVPICLCVPFLLTTSYFNSIQLAVEKVRDYNLVHLIASVSFLPLFLFFYFVVGVHSTDSIADARIAVAVLMTVIVLWMLRGVAKWRPRMHWAFFKAGITYGWKANFTSVLTYLNHRIDLFVLGFLVGTPASGGMAALGPVAFYGQAVSFAELVWHLPESLRDLFFSKVAGASHEESKKFTPILCRLCLAAAVVGGTVLYFAIDPLMSIISPSAWGEKWQTTVMDCYVVLIPGTVAFTVAKVLQADLAGRGHLNQCMVACSIVFSAMIVLDIALIPEHGAVGAAWASSVAYIASATYTLFAYRANGGGGVFECLIARPSDWEYATELFGAIRDKLWRRRS